MLNSVTSWMYTAQDALHPLRPLRSLYHIAKAALACLTAPITGPMALVTLAKGTGSLIDGSIEAAQDIKEASSTLTDLAHAKPVSLKNAAHLTVSMGVVSATVFSLLNPAMVVAAAKVSAMMIAKSLLVICCVI